MADSPKTVEEYHAIAQGIRDIYIQELTAPGAKPREPDEGGWIEWFWHWREEGHDLEWIRARIREEPEWHAVHDRPPEPPVVTLPRLVPHGGVFRLETGARWTAIECSDFALFGRYLIEGADAIRPVLQERADLGFNLLRVWSEYQGNAQFTADIGRLVPSEHPTYYADLALFLALCASYGLYVELTAFTGTGIAGHWDQLGSALQGITNVIVELTNENNAHPGIEPSAYQRIPNILCAHGSNGSQSVPVRPPWDYETTHFNNASQWARKTGHNSREFSVGDPEGVIVPSHVPVIANENTRPDQDGTIQHFHDAAAGAALLCAGSCFHSRSGKKSALLDDVDRPFAEAWVAGATSVPLDCQEGSYRHRSDLEQPDAGKTGERIYQLGSDDRCLVRIRP